MLEIMGYVGSLLIMIGILLCLIVEAIDSIISYTEGRGVVVILSCLVFFASMWKFAEYFASKNNTDFEVVGGIFTSLAGFGLTMLVLTNLFKRLNKRLNKNENNN